jgi:hypothetical protein
VSSTERRVTGLILASWLLPLRASQDLVDQLIPLLLGSPEGFVPDQVHPCKISVALDSGFDLVGA